MELSEYIDKVNMYSENVLNSVNNIGAKSTYINMMKGKKQLARIYLTNIFCRIEVFESYIEYENIDFSKDFEPYSDDKIDNYLKVMDLIKKGAKLIEKPQK